MCQCMNSMTTRSETSESIVHIFQSRFVGESTGNLGVKNIWGRRRRTSEMDLTPPPSNSPQAISQESASLLPSSFCILALGTLQPH